MRALAKCDHPNILRLLDSGTLPDNRMYYTMEYIAGCDLEQVWKEMTKAEDRREPSFASVVLSSSARARREMEARARLPAGDQDLGILPPPLPSIAEPGPGPGTYARQVAGLFRDAARALHAVHEQHVVHRDVSPGNLMVTQDASRIVLMDFGLAKSQNAVGSIGPPGGFVGKLRYAAPEQLAAAKLPVGPAADVRALGVTLWELLTRRRLFGDAADESTLSARILWEDVPPLRRVSPGFDPDLEAIVTRTTERNLADRIQSAAEFADLLQLYVDGKPLPIRPRTRTERLRRWVARRKWPIAAGVISAWAVIACALAVFLVLGAREDVLEEQNRATKNLQMMREAIDSIVTVDMSERPQSRRALLQECARFCDRFIVENWGNADLRVELAWACFRRAAVSREVAEPEAAERSCREAARLIEGLGGDDRSPPGVAYYIAESRVLLALVLVERQQHAEAERLAQSAIELLEGLARRHPGTGRYLGALGTAYDRMGSIVQDTTRSLEWRRKARQIREKQIDESPKGS
jgi:hypothetical protein